MSLELACGLNKADMAVYCSCIKGLASPAEKSLFPSSEVEEALAWSHQEPCYYPIRVNSHLRALLCFSKSLNFGR